MHQISIAVAGLELQVSSPISAEELGIEDRLGKFMSPLRNPLDRVSLKWEDGDGSTPTEGELVFNPGPVWRVYRDGETSHAHFSYRRDGGCAPLCGVLQANATWDDFVLREQRFPSGWCSLLSLGAGELVFRTRLSASDGLMFHASGLDDNGRGVVFTGHSGAGKSTQLGLWRDESGIVEMSDDRMAVRVNSTHGARCYGTPWGGSSDIRNNHSAPLHAIVILGQGPENRIERIPAPAAAPLLLARCFVPYWDRSLLAKALQNLDRIVRRVPVYQLVCRPDKSVIPVVRSVL